MVITITRFDAVLIELDSAWLDEVQLDDAPDEADLPRQVGGRAAPPGQRAATFGAPRPCLRLTISTDRPGLRGVSVLPMPNEPRLASLLAGLADVAGPTLRGLTVDEVAADMGALWSRVEGALAGGGVSLHDGFSAVDALSGPLRIVIGGIIDAAWDLWSRASELPLWQLAAGLAPDQLARCLDLRGLTDDLALERAGSLLAMRVPGRVRRENELRRTGVPVSRVHPAASVAAPISSLADRLGDLADQPPDDLLGQPLVDLRGAFEADRVGQAARLVGSGEAGGPLTGWVAEPALPTDVSGLVAARRALRPLEVAAWGSPNPREIKTLLQSREVDAVRLDVTRLGGVTGTLTALVLAARHKVPVWLHAPDAATARLALHLAIIDYISVAATLDRRRLEVPPAALAGSANSARLALPEGHGISGERLDERVASRR